MHLILENDTLILFKLVYFVNFCKKKRGHLLGGETACKKYVAIRFGGMADNGAEGNPGTAEQRREYPCFGRQAGLLEKITYTF